jgi:hypothetical protein
MSTPIRPASVGPGFTRRSDPECLDPVTLAKDPLVAVTMKSKLTATYPPGPDPIHVDTDTDGLLWLRGRTQ